MCARAIRPGPVGPLPVRTPRDRACGREAVLRVPFPHARCLSLPGREVRVGGREVQRPRPAQRPAGGGEGDAGQVLSARRPRPPRTARLRRRHGFRRSVSPLPHVFVQPGVHPRPPCCQSDIEVVCSLISLVISVPLTPRPPIFGEKPRSRAQTSSGRCSRGRLGASTAATQARTRRLLGTGHPASAESSSPTSPQVPCSVAGTWGVKNSQPFTTVTPAPPRSRGSGSLCPGRAMGSGSCGPPSTLSWVSHCRICVPGGGGAQSPRAGSPHGAGPDRVGPVSRSGECAGGHRRGQWRSARAPQGLSPRRARGCQEGPGLGATAPAAQHRCRGEVGSPKCSS